MVVALTAAGLSIRPPPHSRRAASNWARTAMRVIICGRPGPRRQTASAVIDVSVTSRSSTKAAIWSELSVSLRRQTSDSFEV